VLNFKRIAIFALHLPSKVGEELGEETVAGMEREHVGVMACM